MGTPDTNLHEKIMRTTLRKLSRLNMRLTPPAMAQRIHRSIRKQTGLLDPYFTLKAESNRVALDLCPDLRRCIAASSNPFETAARLAIAGNVIDFGANHGFALSEIETALDEALESKLWGSPPEAIWMAAQSAERILYLADNAGEIAFDRLFIEQLPVEKIVAAVRGAPTLNDATMLDARTVGLTDIVETIDNGSDAPGTVLSSCSKAFQTRFREADLVIAKGQGNYETLSDCGKNIFYLLKVKCEVIGRHIGYPKGSLAIAHRNGSDGAEARTDEKVPYCEEWTANVGAF